MSVTRNPPRPKVVAAGQASVVAGVLAYLLRVCGVNVDDIPPEVLLLAGGTLATLAAYVKRDGLRGAWQHLVDGDPDR